MINTNIEIYIYIWYIFIYIDIIWYTTNINSTTPNKVYTLKIIDIHILYGPASCDRAPKPMWYGRVGAAAPFLLPLRKLKSSSSEICWQGIGKDLDHAFMLNWCLAGANVWQVNDPCTHLLHNKLWYVAIVAQELAIAHRGSILARLDSTRSPLTTGTVVAALLCASARTLIYIYIIYIYLDICIYLDIFRYIFDIHYPSKVPLVYNKYKRYDKLSDSEMG